MPNTQQWSPDCHPANLTCIEASPWKVTLGSTGQTQCEAGTYSLGTAAVCTKCPLGYYSAEVGASSALACQKCAAGSYADTNGSTICKVSVVYIMYHVFLCIINMYWAGMWGSTSCITFFSHTNLMMTVPYAGMRRGFLRRCAGRNILHRGVHAVPAGHVLVAVRGHGVRAVRAWKVSSFFVCIQCVHCTTH